MAIFGNKVTGSDPDLEPEKEKGKDKDSGKGKSVSKKEKDLLKFIHKAIEKGSVFGAAPSRIRFYENHYELLIGIGNDHTASLYISKSALKELGKYGDVGDLLT